MLTDNKLRNMVYQVDIEWNMELGDPGPAANASDPCLWLWDFAGGSSYYLSVRLSFLMWTKDDTRAHGVSPICQSLWAEPCSWKLPLRRGHREISSPEMANSGLFFLSEWPPWRQINRSDRGGEKATQLGCLPARREHSRVLSSELSPESACLKPSDISAC